MFFILYYSNDFVINTKYVIFYNISAPLRIDFGKLCVDLSSDGGNSISVLA